MRELLSAKEQLKNEPFPYSPENPPPLETLLSKIYAVHLTAYLPKNGTILAHASNLDVKFKDQEPPSFRPLVHFTLGGMVKEHSKYTIDNQKYIIITPLHTLLPQLVNVFPHDTFVLGDFKLPPDAIMLVPENETIPDETQKQVTIIKYPINTDLRMLTEEIIAHKDGWHIDITTGDTNYDSPAYIENTEINNIKFFNELLKTDEKISFGTHLSSECGIGFRFGIIEQSVNLLMKTFSSDFFPMTDNIFQMYYIILTHFVQKLDLDIDKSNLPGFSKETYHKKRDKLNNWLEIISYESYLRQRHGKSLRGATSNVYELHNYINTHNLINSLDLDGMHTTTNEPIDNPLLVSELFKSISITEYVETIDKLYHLAKRETLPMISASYALRRMLMLEPGHSDQEELSILLNRSLKIATENAIYKKEEVFNDPIMLILGKYLHTSSTRYGRALQLLQLPIVKEYLVKAVKMRFNEGEPKTIEQVVRAHPITKKILLNSEKKPPFTQKIIEILDNIKYSTNRTVYNQFQAMKSFPDAIQIARGLEFEIQVQNFHIKTIQEPMNKVIAPFGKPKIVPWNYRLERVFRKETKLLWKRLKLEHEYSQVFDNDDDFWNSPKSFLQIYEELESLKLKKQKNKF